MQPLAKQEAARKTRDCKTSGSSPRGRPPMRIALGNKSSCVFDCLSNSWLSNAQLCKLDLVIERRQPRQPLAGWFAQPNLQGCRLKKLPAGARRNGYVELQLKEIANHAHQLIENGHGVVRRFDSHRLKVSNLLEGPFVGSLPDTPLPNSHGK